MKRLPVKVMTGTEVIPPSIEAQFVHEVAAKVSQTARKVPPRHRPDTLAHSNVLCDDVNLQLVT